MKPITADWIDNYRALYGRNGAVDMPQKRKAPRSGGASTNGKKDMTSVAQKVPARNMAFDMPMRKSYGVEVIHVTPEIAQHWLTFNTSNRGLVNKKIEQYQRDMEAGEWRDDGATIRFAHGKLLDGQHRLHALIVAGAKIRFVVVHGLPTEAQATMDTGRNRSSADILSIEGMESWEARTLGAAIHAIIAHESGLPLYATAKAQNHKARDYYLEHSVQLGNSLALVKGLPRKHSIMLHSRMLVLHYFFARKDEQAAAVFFEQLATGANLSRSSPIYQLRTRLEYDAKDGKRRSLREEIGFTIRAWNSYRRGNQMKTDGHLRVRADEPFPEYI